MWRKCHGFADHDVSLLLLQQQQEGMISLPSIC